MNARSVGRWGGLLALATLPVIAAGCGNPGDGRESAGDKREWAILQTVELDAREQPSPREAFRNVDGYELMAISRESDGRTIWIMLKPVHAPFYKQVPEGNFWIDFAQLEQLTKQHRVTTTVESALRSHLRPR